MMFINLEDLSPRIRELIIKLDEAQAEVDKEADPTKRRELIDKYRHRWVALRPFMAELSNNKCWYTESKNPGTDDDVDHYRPKNSVHVEAGEPPHGGYYWLAFKWWNYRLSCHRGNRLRENPETGATGGKGDYFPLVDSAKRVRTPTTDQHELDKEEPLLLDPAKPGDPGVLTFDSNGKVKIHPSRAANPIDVRRFEASRDYYHLDWPAFKDRRVEIYNEVERVITRGLSCAPLPTEPTTKSSREFDNVLRDLIRCMSRDRDFSAAAIAYVRSFRNIWWIQDIVLVVTPGA
jgi:hypothetical protein